MRHLLLAPTVPGSVEADQPAGAIWSLMAEQGLEILEVIKDSHGERIPERTVEQMCSTEDQPRGLFWCSWGSG